MQKIHLKNLPHFGKVLSLEMIGMSLWEKVSLQQRKIASQDRNVYYIDIKSDPPPNLNFLCSKCTYYKPLCLLDRNFFVCRCIILLALVMVSCLANGENSTSLSLHSPWNSFSASPPMVRLTNAFAFFRWELNKPLMDVTKPSPARSLGFFDQDTGKGSYFPGWLPSLSLKFKSLSGEAPSSACIWPWTLSLNFLPYCEEDNQINY